MFWPVAMYTGWWCGPLETHRPHFIPRDAQSMLHTKKPLLFPFHDSADSLRPLLTVTGQFRPLPLGWLVSPLAGASPDSRSLWSSDTVPRNLSCWKGHFPIPGLAQFLMQLWLSLALLVASRSRLAFCHTATRGVSTPVPWPASHPCLGQLQIIPVPGQRS